MRKERHACYRETTLLVSKPRQSYNILVVEDNPGDAHLIEEAFSECRPECKLVFTDKTTAAKELLRSQPFDLVLSDMGVQNAPAVELIRWIRSTERVKALPIVVISGSPDSRLAYEAGANAFIAKTMDMDRLFGNIRGMMHFWTEVAELPSP